MTSQPTPAAVEAVALVLMEQRFGELTSPVAHSIDRGDARAVLRFLLNNPQHLQPYTGGRYWVALDGDDEPTLWRESDSTLGPEAIARRCDVSEAAWDLMRNGIVEGCKSGHDSR